jgi:hypothetical protein
MKQVNPYLEMVNRMSHAAVAMYAETRANEIAILSAIENSDSRDEEVAINSLGYSRMSDEERDRIGVTMRCELSCGVHTLKKKIRYAKTGTIEKREVPEPVQEEIKMSDVTLGLFKGGK